MVTASRPSSLASVRLSRNNNWYGPVLTRVHGESVSPEGKHGPSLGGLAPKEERQKSPDVYAAPLSSSDSEESDKGETEASGLNAFGDGLNHFDKNASLQPGINSHNRQPATSAITTTTRSRTAVVKVPSPSVDIIDLSHKDEDEDDAMSLWPRLKKKRKVNTYITRNIHGSKLGSSNAPESSTTVKPVDLIPRPVQSGQSRANFAVPNPPRSPVLQRKTRSRLKDEKEDFEKPAGDTVLSPRNTSIGKAFEHPLTYLDSTNSSSIAASDPSTIFDSGDLPFVGASIRSAATSSLSSVDSIASLVLTQEEKDALIYNSDEEARPPAPSVDSARCPLCNCPVSASSLSSFSSGRRLGIRAQQRFCRSHKTVDAEKLSRQRGYPEIDWAILETERIPKHIPALVSILKLETGSHYRSSLSDAIQASEGRSKRKALQRYLKQDVVDIAKYGYYGPKGARVMGQAITTVLAGALAKGLERDSIAQAAGVGAYVSAVLVPELTVRLVMEDLGLRDETAAREVMSASAEVGSLLCGDEDEVVKRVEDSIISFE